MLAFLPTLGFQEMFVLLVIGLLLYGRNLPEAGRNLGRMVARLRNSLQQFRDELDRDGSLRELRDVGDSLRDVGNQARRAGSVPRALADPSSVFRDLADEALSSELPPNAPPPGSSLPPPEAGNGHPQD